MRPARKWERGGNATGSIARIDAVYVEGTPDEARMWEIAENLHRAELTALERDEHVAEWIGLAGKPSQPETVSGGRGNEGGLSKASRDLGIDRDDARRAVKVAGLAPDAKQAARDAGLADNRTALLQAAREPPERWRDSCGAHSAAPPSPALFRLGRSCGASGPARSSSSGPTLRSRAGTCGVA